MLNLVIGIGSIGKRHARNLLSLDEKVIVFDFENDVNKKICSELKVEFFNEFELAFERLAAGDRVFICSPANHHIDYAIACANKGIDIFIEKPLSASLENANLLREIVERKQVISMVACNLRFDKMLSKVKDILNQKYLGKIYSLKCEFGFDLKKWRAGQDYRHNYAVKKEAGGGIVLDCIHELDYLCWLLNDLPSDWSSFVGKVSNLEIDTEDIAVIVSKFQQNIFAEIHLDYLQQEYSRSCKIIGEKGTLEWKFQSNGSTLSLSSGNDLVNYNSESDFDINTMYIDQLKYFIDCTKNRLKTFNDIARSIEILKWGISIRDTR